MVASYGLPECVDWVERESGWHERKGKLPKGKGVSKGLGFACSHYISGASKPVNWTGEPHATVKIKLDFDGSVVVLSGAADIGQGSSTILVQTVAEVLGLDLSRVRVVTGDSEVVPKDNGSYSSRVTFMVGNAAIDAARNLKGVLVAAAARKLETRPEDIECLGELYRAGAQDKGLTFNEVVVEALKDTGTITVTGNYSTIPDSHGGKKYRGAAIGGTMGYSYSAQVVEVTVDDETGVVTVDKVWVAHDCGKALNRLTRRGPGAGLGLDGHGPGHERGDRLSRRPDGHRQHARLPRADHPGLAADRSGHRREQRSARAVRRQGGRRRLARGVPAGADQRHRRRHRRPLQRPAGDARPRVRGDREAAPQGQQWWNVMLIAPLRCPAESGESQTASTSTPLAQGRAAIPLAGHSSMDALPNFRCQCDDARRRAQGARRASRQQAARRRHRSRGQHPARHRRAAGADRRHRTSRSCAPSRPTRNRSRSARRSRWPNWPSIPTCCATIPWWRRRPAPSPGPTHRNMGTVGGNLCLDTRCIYYNQSDWWRGAIHHCLKTTGEICHVAPKSRGVCFATFSGDLAPALLTLGAEVDIAGPAGRRTLPLAKLYIGFARQDQPVTETLGDGKYFLSLRPGEFVTAVRARNTPGLRSGYDKIRIRRSIEYPVCGVAVALRRDGDTLADLRVAFTGTNPRPVLLEGTDTLCGGAARRARVQGPRRSGARPDHGDEDHLHARPLPPPRRRRAGAPAGATIVGYRRLSYGYCLKDREPTP